MIWLKSTLEPNSEITWSRAAETFRYPNRDALPLGLPSSALMKLDGLCLGLRNMRWRI